MEYAARCAAYCVRAQCSLDEWLPSPSDVSSANALPKKIKKKSKASKVKAPFPACLNVCRAHLGLPLAAELLEHQVIRKKNLEGLVLCMH